MTQALHFARQFFILFVLVLSASWAQAQENKGFLWKVSDSNSSVYLLGSVHFANANYYPMSQAIETAFAEADVLGVEVDMTAIDPVKTQQMIQQMGTYPPGHTLQDELSPETWLALENYLALQGIPAHLVINQKPGMLIMTLTSMELMKLGMSPQFGIDLHFLSRAKGKKQIVELETLEQQMALLLKMDDGDAAMRQTLDEFPTFPALSDHLFSAWQSGDTRSLEKLLIEEPLQKYPESKPYFDKMFTERNIKMAEKVRSYLGNNKTYLVIVGAGHLIGDQGIVSLLEQKGLKVERY